MEFKSIGFSDVYRKNDLRQTFSALDTPQDNGKIDRVWDTVSGKARCMMETAGVPKQLSPYAPATSFCANNWSLHSADNLIPFEVFHGTKPSLDIMQRFRYRAFLYDEGSKKLDSKARKRILLGYSSSSNC